MATLAQTRHRFLKHLVLVVGTLLLMAGILIGGWLLWITLRPPPDGFAPTVGQAAGVIGQPSGVVQYTIDARSRKDWAYFDFSGGTAVSTSQEELDWDLAFRRTDILTNGGETNTAGQGGAIGLGETPLAEATFPEDGFLADAADDERGLENPALHKWYNYNWTSHIVTSKGHTYAVRAATGEAVLVTFTSYYCDDGSSGCVTFQYVNADGP
jgi:hypothetical protein